MVSRDKLVEEVLKYSQKIYEFYKIIEYKKYATNILDNILLDNLDLGNNHDIMVAEILSMIRTKIAIDSNNKRISFTICRDLYNISDSRLFEKEIETIYNELNLSKYKVKYDFLSSIKDENNLTVVALFTFDKESLNIIQSEYKNSCDEINDSIIEEMEKEKR